MKLLILITSFFAVYCRAQNQDANSPQPVKLEALELNSEAQNMYRLPETPEVKDVTSEILRKIQQINQKHGYTTRRPIKKDHNLFSHFYTYSNQHPKPLWRVTNSDNNAYYTRPAGVNIEKDRMQVEDSNSQRIKRKITHQQNYFLPQKPPPVQYVMMVPVIQEIPMQPYNRYNYIKQIYNQNYNKNEDYSLNYLEQQMLDNLKSIILKSQLPPNIEGITFNPLVQELPHENSFVQYRKPDFIYGSSGYINNIPNMPWNVYQYDGYAPDKHIEPSPLKSNTPMALYNSLTTITEYDNDGEKCKTIDPNDNSRNGKSQLFNADVLGRKYIVDVDKSIEVAAFTEGNSPDSALILVDQGNKKMVDNLENKKPDVDNEFNDRIEKFRKITKPVKTVNQNIKEDEKTLSLLQLLLQHQQNKNKPLTTPSDIKKDIINEDGKKVLSKDNTGSGIFIHRLKVRKGGVAIAGPGGIATAGSGGTAIVGPNGYAYTHPDSLAIAGSGSKVIAVDPSVNLGDIVKGKEDGNRVGKLVAVGPVIYYNKG